MGSREGKLRFRPVLTRYANPHVFPPGLAFRVFVKDMSMREVLISSGKAVSIVDDSDFDLVSQFNWSLTATSESNKKQYAHRRNRTSGGLVLMHRFILDMPKKNGLCVDHINGDTLDNRRCNLRICTQGENMRNYRHAWGKEGIRGVMQTRTGKYRARIRFNNVLYHIGTFDTQQDASVAYAFASGLLHGEFGSLPGHEAFIAQNVINESD